MNVKNVQNKIPFFKMMSSSNDFIFLDKKYFFSLRNHVKLICDRKMGIGCDQLIVYSEDIQNKALQLDIINNDGTHAEACGNAFRCAGDYFCVKNSWEFLSIIANNKEYPVKYKDNTSYVDMGKPLFKEIMLNGVDLLQYKNPFYVNVGNPHVILLSDKEILKEEVISLGKIIENHKMFPKKTNVNFAKVLDRNSIEIYTWERGIGYSESCGTGATATYVALFQQGLLDEKATVHTQGGDIEVLLKNDKVIISGKTLFVFEGIYTIPDFNAIQ